MYTSETILSDLDKLEKEIHADLDTVLSNFMVEKENKIKALMQAYFYDLHKHYHNHTFVLSDGMGQKSIDVFKNMTYLSKGELQSSFLVIGACLPDGADRNLYYGTYNGYASDYRDVRETALAIQLSKVLDKVVGMSNVDAGIYLDVNRVISNPEVKTKKELEKEVGYNG